MVIGLTGGIGAGKSTVANLFRREGAFVVDTDVVARHVVAPPSPVLDALAAEFGKSIIQPDGTLNRRLLAAIVFGDPKRMLRLNAITHPAIRARTLELIEAEPADSTIIVVVPLLFQSGFDKHCDQTISVVAPADERRRRLMARDGATAADVDARMAAQLPDEEYERRADLVIRNTGDLNELAREVAAVWSSITLS
jgi:dephospho-CoA kinase